MNRLQLQCRGWWHQSLYGRQPMEPLELCIEQTSVTGIGSDIIGDFTLRGRYIGKEISMIKRYVQQHSVEYVGEYDGEGNWHGVWRINDCSGEWGIHTLATPGESQIKDWP